MMDGFYKLYIGDFTLKSVICAAPTMIEPSVNFLGLPNQVKKSLTKIHKGLDLYIKKPNGEVLAWYRDLNGLSKDEIRERLK